MKASLVAAAAALLTGGASAGHVQHRQAHDLFKVAKRGNDTASVCVPGCTTIYSTITGSAGLWTPPPSPSTTKPVAVAAAAVTPTTTSSAPVLVPTPIAQTCPTPGTYTFPATTVVITETTTVCAASTTKVPAGTHTLGGVTTVVTTATTVTCPYATVKTEAGVVTSVIESTVYVCPSAGTYTIAPITTVVVTEKVVAVPVVATYAPGTYTADAQIVTVTETDFVYYCPFTSPAPPAPAAPTATAVAAPPPPPPAATTAAAAPTAKPSTPASSPATGSGGLSEDQPQLGITYTPYNPDGTCKSPEGVLADIAEISSHGFKRVRVYSTDCDTLPNVGAACEAHGVTMILGIFIGEVGCDNGSPDVAEQISAIKAWGKWNLADLVVVGNEALFNQYCSVQQLKDLIVHVKNELGGAGYTGPYTTTDVVSAWLQPDVKQICDVLDFPCANIHSYFNSATTPETAGSFVAGQLQIVEDVCGKSGYIMETGWPTQGKCFGEACPGQEQQATAIKAIKDECGPKAIFFSFKNDLWKPDSDCGCERSWGISGLLGTVF